MSEPTESEKRFMEALWAETPPPAHVVRERARRRMADEGIPVGTDDPGLLALGAPPVPDTGAEAERCKVVMPFIPGKSNPYYCNQPMPCSAHPPTPDTGAEP